MLRYDQHPARQRDSVAQRQAMLDTIVDYRFLAPHKIAADELRDRQMAYAAQAPDAANPALAARRQGLDVLRHRLGAVLIAAGVRLQRNTAITLDPQPRT